MGSGLKNKKNRKEPDAFYNPSKEEWEAYRWCIKNNIAISYVPLDKGNNPINYKVSVHFNGNYKDRHLSPQTYNLKDVAAETWKAMMYYYNKRNND